jgi:hypothetical protein
VPTCAFPIQLRILIPQETLHMLLEELRRLGGFPLDLSILLHAMQLTSRVD